MNYELAKELKDAGFPHEWCKDMSEKAPQMCGSTCEEMDCYPTLEELIEACGDVKFALFGPGTSLQTEEDTAFGVVLHGKEQISGWLAKGTDTAARGSSPTEAVARLWLALNTK